MSTMHAWRSGHIRVYRPSDNPTTLITMPGHFRWPAMDPRDYSRIDSATVPETWVTESLIHEGITEIGVDSADHCLMEPPVWLMSEMAVPPQSQPSSAVSALLALMGSSHQVPALVSLPPLIPQHKVSAATTTLPTHVSAIVLKEAITSAATCPITMEPITSATGVVTGCGHVFQRDAITKWLGEHGTCPECRQTTKI